MSLFNIIGKDCEDIIMEYKRQLDEHEFEEKQKVMNQFRHVLQDIILYKGRKRVEKMYALEYRWCMAWGEYLTAFGDILV